MTSISLRDFRMLDHVRTNDPGEVDHHVYKIIPPGAPRQILVAEDFSRSERTLTGDRDLFDQPATVGSLEANNESGRAGWTLWRRGDAGQSKVYQFDSTVNQKYFAYSGISVVINVDGVDRSQMGEKLSMTLIPIGKTQRLARWESGTHYWGTVDGKDDSEFIFYFDAKLGGLRGQYQAQIRDSNGRNYDVQGTPTIEFYWLQTAKLPSYFDKGIPLSLLRMFLLPAATPNVGRFPTSEWVETATKIVHGSRKPFSGETCSTAGHWLKYETGSGSNSFMSSPRGTGGFDVLAWLDAWRLYTQHKKVTTVNCYDQAAALEVALTLGMSYQRIAWEYHVVYGFVPTTELVGWGPCNNPYFEYTNPKILSETDNTRSLFRNHAYLCWNENGDIDDSTIKEYNIRMNGIASTADYAKTAKAFEQEKNLKLKMLDACAGPHIGNESREEYERGLGRVTPPYSEHKNNNVRAWADKDKSWSDEEHYLGRGITSMGERADKDIHHFGYMMGPKFAKCVAEVERLLPKANSEELVVSGRYKDLFRAMQSVVKDVHPNWSNLAFVPIRDLNTNDLTSTRELKFHYNKPGASSEACFVSMEVTLSPLPSVARQRLSDELVMNALTTTNNPTQQYVVINQPAQQLNLIGAGSVRAFLFCNLTIEIDGPEMWSDDPENRFGKAIMECVQRLGTKKRDASWQDFWKA